MTVWRCFLVASRLYSAIAVVLGSTAAFLLARRLKRTTFGLELEEIAGLLQDREAMLHGIREGVVAFAPDGRITVVNDTLRGAHDALSAAEAAERTGVSRATAQRYLSYLVKEGMVRLELRYGATGRPEHLYRIAQ